MFRFEQVETQEWWLFFLEHYLIPQLRAIHEELEYATNIEEVRYLQGKAAAIRDMIEGAQREKSERAFHNSQEGKIDVSRRSRRDRR